VALIKIDHNPSARTLGWFGLLLGVFLGLLGVVARFRFGAPSVAMGLWITSVLVVTAYYLAPPIRKPLYLGWMYAAYPIGFVMSYVVLGVTYFLVVTPIGLVMRLAGNDPMQRRFDRSAATYWVTRTPTTDSRRYFRQF
jgi:ABC-type uncharacterized transport system permease subunit